MRATVTTDEAAPNARRPAASTAAVERGVTVSPKPNPKTRQRAGDGRDAGVGRPRSPSPRARRCDNPRPTSVATRSDTTRSAKPETRAPSAVAPARAPSASRWSPGPPYRTRSTKTAPPMIAVANAYPVSSETSATRPRRPGSRNSRGSRNGSGRRRPWTTAATVSTTAATSSAAVTTVGSARPPAIWVEPIEGQADEAGQEREAEPGGPDHVDAPGRRGVSQPDDAAQPIRSATRPIGTLMKNT